jgi:Protein of unknown function (DUF4238)
MKNNEVTKRGHHIVPRTYLRNFCKDDPNRKAIHVHNLPVSENTKAYKANIDKVAKENDFYMLEGNTEAQKLAIENYFASEIEAPYQSHYEKWIDPEIVFITPKDRLYLITFVASMHLRTRRFADMYTQLTKQIIDTARYWANGREVLTIDGSEIQLRSPEGQKIPSEALAKQDLEKNRSNVIKDQMSFLRNLVRLRLFTSEIVIIKIEGSNKEFITSDIPVTLLNKTDEITTPFDPETYMFLAIDPVHLIALSMRRCEFITPKIGRATICDSSRIDAYNELHYGGSGRFIFGTFDGITSSLSRYRPKPQ